MRGPSEQHGRKALPPSNSNTSSIFPRGIHSPLLPSPLVSTLTSNIYYKKTVLFITQQAQPVLAFPQGPQSTSRAGRGSRSSCHHAVPGWFRHSTTSTARA